MATDRAIFFTQQAGDTVSSTKTFPLDRSESSKYIGNLDGVVMLQVVWDNSTGPMDFDIEPMVSADPDYPFVTPTSAMFTSTDLTGSHSWDIATGAHFMQVKITIRSGSARFRIKLVGRDL